MKGRKLDSSVGMQRLSFVILRLRNFPSFEGDAQYPFVLSVLASAFRSPLHTLLYAAQVTGIILLPRVIGVIIPQDFSILLTTITSYHILSKERVQF